MTVIQTVVTMNNSEIADITTQFITNFAFTSRCYFGITESICCDGGKGRRMNYLVFLSWIGVLNADWDGVAPARNRGVGVAPGVRPGFTHLVNTISMYHFRYHFNYLLVS